MGRAYGEIVSQDLEETQSRAWKRWSDMEGTGVLYRVEAVRYSGCTLTAWDSEEYYTTSPRLEVFGFAVERWTPHGATLRSEWAGCRKKWVDLRDGANQFASRNLADAVQQFAERRRRQIWVLSRQLSRAEEELVLADQRLLPLELKG